MFYKKYLILVCTVYCEGGNEGADVDGGGGSGGGGGGCGDGVWW